VKLWARRAYLAVTFVAFPAIIWPAFEMYGLTLRGPQMLFFSVIHTMPTLVAVVLVSCLFFVVWLLLNCAALLSRAVRSALGVPVPLAGALAAFQLIHVGALASYESWSYVSLLRVPLCVLGLLLCGAALVLAIRGAVAPNPSIERTA